MSVRSAKRGGAPDVPTRDRPARRLLRRAFAAALGVLATALAAELLVRALLEPPPEPGFFERVTIADHDALWRFRPFLDDLWPHPERARRRAVPFRTNGAGRREREVDVPGRGEPLVIACLGDSSTAGYGVADDEHYPHRLGALLAPHVGRPLAVRNFGVIGYTVRQGRAQFERDVLPQGPSIVTIAFGYNDGYVTRTDEERRTRNVPPRGLEPLHDALLRRSRLYRWWWTNTHPERALPTPRPRVSRAAFREHLEALIDRVRACGARPVLLDLALPNAWLRDVGRRIADERGLPYLCARELLTQHAARDGVAPFFPDVYGGSAEVPHIRVRWDRTRDPVLVTSDLRLPTRSFATLPLHDDGTHGDEVAGDGVFALAFPRATQALDLEFAITSRKNLDAHPEHPNHILYRRLTLPPEHGFDGPVWTAETWLAPLEPYLLEGDLGHPNPKGHARIAEALAALLVELVRDLDG